MPPSPWRYLNGRLFLFSFTATLILLVVYQQFKVKQWLKVVQVHENTPLSHERISEEDQRPSDPNQGPSNPPPLWNSSHANSPAVSSQQFYNDLSKSVVVATQAHENITWVTHELPLGWDYVLMVVDNLTAPQHTPTNKGREAAAYLWYILENYDQLPDTMVFMHAHRSGELDAWHVDNEEHSNPLSVRQLRIANVQERGFVNLRCQTKPGCPVAIQVARDPPDPDFQTEFAMPAALKTMFGMEPHQSPSVIAAPCCSQFAVSKRQVLERSKGDYQRYWKWLMDTKLDDAISGRVFEYLWHIIFGRNAVYCPEPQDCYCSNYGLQCHE